MKFFAVLGALVVQCAATKSWTGDSYSEEAYSVFGWLGYLKRLSLIALMLSGVILYYVPESRPHARRMCYALIDFTANGLKSALSDHESEYMYEKIKSKYHRARYEQSLAAPKHRSREAQNDDGDYEHAQKNRERKTKTSTIFLRDESLLNGFEKKKLNGKQSKEETRHRRQSRHRLRNSVVKDASGQPCMDLAKPIYFHTDKLKDHQKYLKSSMFDAKRGNGAALENYAVLISGNPQQMAMLEQKYDKDDVVILQDPYLRVEYKECGTSVEKLSSKAEVSISDLEGPTRDRNDRETDSGMETYACKEIESISVPEGNSPRFSDYRSLYQTSQYECGDNVCSLSSTDFNNNDVAVASPIDIKNVLKSSLSLIAPTTNIKMAENDESLFVGNYSNYNSRTLKSGNDRKVDFRKEEKKERVEARSPQNRDDTVQRFESMTRSVRKRKPRGDNPSTGHRRDVSYLTDRGGEADDENSHYGDRLIVKLHLDERPEREGPSFRADSDDSIFDYRYDEFSEKPILKNRLKPALLRAVNWIFGGCPEAARRAEMKRSEVGKEETRESADEWLL